MYGVAFMFCDALLCVSSAHATDVHRHAALAEALLRASVLSDGLSSLNVKGLWCLQGGSTCSMVSTQDQC